MAASSSRSSATVESKELFKNYFLVSRDLTSYLKSLPNDVLPELFSHPQACLCIFRSLPKLGQHYILRMLYTEIPVNRAVASTWCLSDFRNNFEEAMELLQSLQIMTESTMSGGFTGIILTHRFRHNLKVALLGGGRSWTESSQLRADNRPKSESTLDDYALSRWEAILQFLTDSQATGDQISADTIKTLQHAGLMEDDDSGRPTITSKGFQFLLLDTASQVWFFLVKYLETVTSFGLNLVECLAFLFSLSLSTVGKDYGTQGLSEQMLVFVQHLREFGLLNQRSRKAQKYFPTKLAVDWYSSTKTISWDTDKHKTGYLIVETNYRVYAYTTSELQVALVAMFTKFQYRFPTMVVALITRDSISLALRNGISAHQIISYMQTHLHPNMTSGANLATIGLPPTVIDQIRLWELERKRLVFTESVLYNQFLSLEDYEIVRNYARDKGYMIFCSDQKRIVVVSTIGHDDVRKFWKRHSKSQ